MRIPAWVHESEEINYRISDEASVKPKVMCDRRETGCTCLQAAEECKIAVQRRGRMFRDGIPCGESEREIERESVWVRWECENRKVGSRRKLTLKASMSSSHS